jgi:hypothetical protein
MICIKKLVLLITLGVVFLGSITLVDSANLTAANTPAAQIEATVSPAPSDGSIQVKEEWLSYGDFIDKYPGFGDDPTRAEDRMTRVVILRYPEGITLSGDNCNWKYGAPPLRIDDAMTISCYDAATGELLVNSVSAWRAID